MSNGLLKIAADETIRLYNSRVFELLGLSSDELSIGMSLAQYLHNVGNHAGWDGTRKTGIIDKHRSWMKQETMTRVEHHFDDGMILRVSCQPLADGGAILTYDDITAVHAAQKQITHMAFHDPLTGMSNRRSFNEKIERLSHDGDFGLLMVDLDRFKAVNDTFGHGVGDRLLVEVAARLRDICGPSVQLFRLGGDEFAVLTLSTRDEAAAWGMDAVAALMCPFDIQEHTISIGGSVGIAMAQQGDNPEMVQRKADLALYKAKASGRGRIEFYHEGMIEDAEARRKLEEDLWSAVEAGQFELNYQPLFVLPGRKISGFEALLRWHHPELGLIPPSEFIPVAEQSSRTLSG